jgi:hypothetical protein
MFMTDYTSKAPFGKDIMPHNKEAGFSQLHNTPATFAETLNKGNTDTKEIKKATKSIATPATGGGAFKSFIGGK